MTGMGLGVRSTPNWSRLGSKPRSSFEPGLVSSPAQKQLLHPLLCSSEWRDVPWCFFFNLQTSCTAPYARESPHGMEKAPRLLGLPAAAQGMVSDRVKETNCLPSAGEKLWEQMARSFFSLLLLPSEWEKSERFRGWSTRRLTNRCWTLSGILADAVAWEEGTGGCRTRRDGERCVVSWCPLGRGGWGGLLVGDQEGSCKPGRTVECVRSDTHRGLWGKAHWLHLSWV